jgi:capsular polysaccharide biosynthesis protein
MDVQLYLRVLWRFKLVVIGGVVLGCALAVLAVKHRSQTYRSHTTLFVTQQGFPWGRTGAVTNGQSVLVPGAAATALGDPQRLATLTALYAKLATGDGVQDGLIPSSMRTHESIAVSAVPAPAYSTPAILPLLEISATAPTAARAIGLADDATSGFQSWLEAQQNAAGIDRGSRVIVQVVNHAARADSVGHHSKALPVMIAMTVMAAAVGLAFVLENLMPREQRLTASEASPVPAPPFAA